jgi:hypothetical protein
MFQRREKSWFDAPLARRAALAASALALASFLVSGGHAVRAEPEAAAFQPDQASALWPAAIFGEDLRQPIWDLLRRDAGSLSAEERAIVQAVGRIGTISCYGAGSNGSLIRLTDGRDAVITSAHTFIDANGPKCDLTTVTFLPNTSFHMGGDFTDFVLRDVATTGALPLNHDNRDLLPTNIALNGEVIAESDFLIFPLAAPISGDIMPDGSIRGFIQLATKIPEEGTAYLIGVTTHFLGGYTPGYEACRYRNAKPLFYHLCATNSGTSSSPVMLFDGRELILAGLHSGSQSGQSDRVVPLPRDPSGGNIALSMDTVRAYLDSIGQPAVTAPATEAGQDVEEFEL